RTEEREELTLHHLERQRADDDLRREPLGKPPNLELDLAAGHRLAQHFLVPAHEVGGAVLVHLLVVERHHVLEVVLLHGVMGHLGRKLGFPAGRRVAKAPRHLELELGIEGDVDELLRLPLELGALQDRKAVADLDAALRIDDVHRHALRLEGEQRPFQNGIIQISSRVYALSVTSVFSMMSASFFLASSAMAFMPGSILSGVPPRDWLSACSHWMPTQP